MFCQLLFGRLEDIIHLLSYREKPYNFLILKQFFFFFFKCSARTY